MTARLAVTLTTDELAALVEGAVAKALAGHRPDASLTTRQVADILGYTPSFVVRLAKGKVLKSDGEGRGRRYRPEYVEDFRRRVKAAGGRIWDVNAMTRPPSEDRAATATH